MANSRQEEINLAKEIINQEINWLNREVQLVDQLLSECENYSEIEQKYNIISAIASIEEDTTKYQKKLSRIIDSFATATDTINKKKFLLLDSQSLLIFREKIDSLKRVLRSYIHNNFFGAPRGRLVEELKRKNYSEMSNSVSMLKKEVLIPMLTILKSTKEDILILEESLIHKQMLYDAEQSKESQTANSEFSVYYHATDDFSNFENGQLRNTDFFLGKTPAQAIAHKSGFSASANFKIIRIKIAKPIEEKIIRPYTVDSYADADMNCYYIDKNLIPVVNNHIKAGKLIFLEKLH